MKVMVAELATQLTKLSLTLPFFIDHRMRFLLRRMSLVVRGAPYHIRFDDGPEFVAKKIRCWPDQANGEMLFIAIGSPCKRGDMELLRDKLDDERPC